MLKSVKDIKTKESLTVYDSRLLDGEYEIYCLTNEKKSVTKKREDLIYKMDYEDIKFLKNADYNSLPEGRKRAYNTILDNLCKRLRLSKIEVLNIDIESLAIQ